MGSESFEAIYRNQLGKGYGIFEGDVDRLRSDPKARVVLLRNDGIPKRAEGQLVELEWTGNEARPGVWRYDVKIQGLRNVPYIRIDFTGFRLGVKVLD
jgi:hypothetical protein